MEFGGFEEYILDDEEGGEGLAIRLWPDLNNEQLQREGQAPVFYWSPNSLRLARFADTGDFKFSHVHFTGVMSSEDTVGVDGEFETAGGLINFTTTSRMPPAAMAKLQEQINDKRRSDDRPFWRWFGSREPNITMVPIRGNLASISSLSPTTPLDALPDADGGDGGGGDPSIGERSLRTRNGIRHDVALRGAENLGLWDVRLDGTGPGSITGGENAYGGLLGSIPSELVWAAMHGNASPFFVSQRLLIPMATPIVELSIDGDWSSVRNHFSAAASGGAFFAKAEIAAEFEKLRQQGDITVSVVVDQTLPGADAIAERLEKSADLLVDKFTDLAMKTIFAPVTPIEAAKAPKRKGWSPWSFGASVKIVQRQHSLRINFRREQVFKYNREDVISSTLVGLRRELEANPDAAGKYFSRVPLGDLSAKLRRIVHPVANWQSDPSQLWRGDPVSGIGVQFGYPMLDGELRWKGRQFTAAGGDSQSWEPEWPQHRAGEVTDAPAGWSTDETFVKRTVFFDEPPSALEDPHNRVIVEKNVVQLDPAPHGTLVSDISVDVRVDSVGVLEVGPIQLGTVLADDTQVVEVEIKPDGEYQDDDGATRPRDSVRFSFTGSDQAEPRRLKLFTGDPTYVPAFKYRVRVIVKGTLFTDGMEWSGGWVDGAGTGPLTVEVPKPNEAVAAPRALTRSEKFALPDDDGAVEPRSDADEAELIGAVERWATSRSVAPTGGTEVEGYALDLADVPPEMVGRSHG